MTKEEITICKMYLDDLDKTHNCNEYKLLMHLLEQQPCEDAISKASVFEIMGNLMGIPYDFDRQITEKDVSESMDEIRNLPPVTPTRKKGFWIMTNDYITTAYGTIDYVKCSCCGEECLEEGNYCPNCGAEMEDEI